MNTFFMGTTAFAIPSLEGLIEAGHWIARIYTQPPRPAGRGQNQRLSPGHEFADANEIDVRTPETLRDPAERVEFAALRPEAVVVVDPGREYNCVREARILGINVIALIDTDSDPDTIDLPIPGNDDSIRSIRLILDHLADAVKEGKAMVPEEKPVPHKDEPKARPTR